LIMNKFLLIATTLHLCSCVSNYHREKECSKESCTFCHPPVKIDTKYNKDPKTGKESGEVFFSYSWGGPNDKKEGS
jgi:hypothetical protein